MTSKSHFFMQTVNACRKKCHTSLVENFLQLLDMIITYLMIPKESVKEFV